MNKMLKRESFFIYSSFLTHERPNVLVFGAYDTHDKFCILEIHEIPFYVQIKLDDFKKDYDFLQSYISKSKWHTDMYETKSRHITSTIELMTISSNDLAFIKSLQYILQSRGISLYTHYNYQDAFSSGYMASYIGLEGLCHWYDLQCQEENVPNIWSQSHKIRCQRYFRIKYSSLIISKNQLINKKVEMRRICIYIKSEPYIGNRKRVYEQQNDSNVIYSIYLKYDTILHLTTKIHETNRDIEIYKCERDLLLGLSKHIISGNFDILFVFDIDKQFQLLRQRFQVHGLYNNFDTILTKHPHCFPKCLTKNIKQFCGLGITVIDTQKHLKESNNEIDVLIEMEKNLINSHQHLLKTLEILE